MTRSTGIHAYLRTDIDYITEDVRGGRGMVVGIRDEGKSEYKDEKQIFEKGLAQFSSEIVLRVRR